MALKVFCRHKGSGLWVWCCSETKRKGLHTKQEAERCVERIKSAYPEYRFKIEVS
jgi:hypothetical protein